jgi:hypothetical protein
MTTKSENELLEKLNDKLQELATQFQVHIEGDKERSKQLCVINKTLNVDNGHEAVVTTVRRSAEWINAANRVIWLVIGALVVAATGLCGTVTIGLASLGYLVLKVVPLLQSIDKSGIISRAIFK